MRNSLGGNVASGLGAGGMGSGIDWGSIGAAAGG